MDPGRAPEGTSREGSGHGQSRCDCPLLSLVTARQSPAPGSASQTQLCAHGSLTPGPCFHRGNHGHSSCPALWVVGRLCAPPWTAGTSRLLCLWLPLPVALTASVSGVTVWISQEMHSPSPVILLCVMSFGVPAEKAGADHPPCAIGLSDRVCWTGVWVLASASLRAAATGLRAACNSPFFSLKLWRTLGLKLFITRQTQFPSLFISREGQKCDFFFVN